MKKAVTIVLAFVIALPLVASPVIASMLIAEHLSGHFQSQRALLLADEIMRRTDETTQQAQMALQTLAANKGGPACSDTEIALMRKLAISASLLQSVGRIQGTRLICSSLGDHGAGFELGPPDAVSAIGTAMRVAARLPLAPQSAFIIVESQGYAAIIHQKLVFDVPEDEALSSLAVVGSTSGQLIAARGNVDPSWTRPLAKGEARVFTAGGFLVAERRSRFYDLTAVAAIPAEVVALKSRELTLFLAPVGLLLGLALAWACRLLVSNRKSIPALLRAALRREEFFLVYQPIVRLDTGQCIGAEALLRWRRRDGTLIGPDKFIPIAEKTSIITSITRRVFALVEREVPAMVTAFPHLRISVNLSARDLQSNDTAQQLGELMSRSGIRPGNLLVEATESGFIDTERAIAVIRDIRRAGIGVAVDDFGTGYSCLSHLTTLDLDLLKIDKSFIATIGSSASNDGVLPHIIAMAKSLDLGMVAEGVETEAQAEFLRGRGVQFAQGWLFAKPMSAAEFFRYVHAQTVALRDAGATTPCSSSPRQAQIADRADSRAQENVI